MWYNISVFLKTTQLLSINTYFFLLSAGNAFQCLKLKETMKVCEERKMFYISVF